MLSFWTSLFDVLEAGHSAFLAVVVHNTPHSPGTQGAKMWIAPDGRQGGTIGGGKMEFAVIQDALHALASASFEPSYQTLHHRKTTQGRPSGMICAGEQTNLYLLCHPQRDLPALRTLVSLLANDRPGRLCLSPQGISVLSEPPDLSRPAFHFLPSTSPDPAPSESSSPSWLYQEELLSRKRIAIVGGGHCGFSLSRTMKLLGYHTTVFDTRPDLPSFRDNPWADRIVTVSRFCDVGDLIPWPSLTHVVVMTVDCPSDTLALRGLLGRPFPFLAVMGSPAKIAKIRKDLLDDGFSSDLLRSIIAPAGLPIHSHTPEEIAISIAAQILQLRPSLFPPAYG